MTQAQIKNIFFILISCILFFLEIMLFALVQKYNVYLVLCFFITLITQQPQKRALVYPLLLMCILSYLEVNIFGWCLVYVIPTIILANFLHQNVRIKTIIPYLLLMFALLLKTIIVWWIHGVTISIMHAMELTCYNAFVIGLFLILSSQFEKIVKKYLAEF